MKLTLISINPTMIQLSREEKMTFVHSYIQNEIDLNIINEKTNKTFEESILKEFDDLLELSDINNLVSWHKSLKLPKVKVEDLKERIIKTTEGSVLVGIRFLGMDINTPFVSIWANYSLENQLGNIISLVKKDFKIFNPKFMRFWVKPNSGLSIKYQAQIEQSFYLNSIQSICKLESVLNYNDVYLTPITDLAFYDWYKDIYNKFHLENPNLKFLVSLTSKEDFNKSIQKNLVFHIHFLGTKIGVISAFEQNFLGRESLYITEIVISKEFRGKKLATAAQRKFIETFKNKYQYIWGMISAKNIPSSKNALRVGRKIISSEILLPL